MSLRSLLLLAALLLSVSVAAQSSATDVFMSYWINMTAVRQCADDAPSICLYIPKEDFIDPRRTLTVAVYRCGADTCAVGRITPRYSLLTHIISNTTYQWYLIKVPRPGLLYAWADFRIGPPGSGDSGKVWSTSYTMCGRTYLYAYYVSPGTYNITPLRLPLYLVDPETCVEYRFADHVNNNINITTGWYTLYIAELNPPARGIYYDANINTHILNGTAHAYLTFFYGTKPLQPLGEGFYILQTPTQTNTAPTLVMPQYSHGGYRNYRGPVAFDVWRNYMPSVGSPGTLYIHYNIGHYPGDGYFMATLLGAAPPAPAELAYVADGSAGYFAIKRRFSGLGAGYITYHRRHALVEVAFADALYVYNTRGLACPMTTTFLYGVGWALNRLDRVYEIEICNNRTDTVYAVLYYTAITFPAPGLISSVDGYGFHVYMYGDVVRPGNCSRLRWDAAIVSKPQLRIYRSAGDVCFVRNNHTLATTNYNPGWRYNLVGNSLVPVGPIAPDYQYASTWLDLFRYLSQLYQSLLSDLLKALNATRSSSATKPLNLTGVFSMRQFLGTIRMDSATSTWLRTTLNELQKWRVVGVSAGGAVSVSLQAPSALAASAAAVAVATAWAASRRSLATAAFLAGFAILATALFTAALYGATVAATLILVGTILMAVGAAAAWQKQTGEE